MYIIYVMFLISSYVMFLHACLFSVFDDLFISKVGTFITVWALLGLVFSHGRKEAARLCAKNVSGNSTTLV